MSQAKGRQHRLLCKLNEKAMSDEESDPDEPNSLIRRSPPWRSEKLNGLFSSLDEQYEAKHGGHSTKRKRRIGPSTERIQPQGLPTWALLSTEQPPGSPIDHVQTPTDPATDPLQTPTDAVLTPSETTPARFTTGSSLRAQDNRTRLRAQNSHTRLRSQDSHSTRLLAEDSCS